MVIDTSALVAIILGEDQAAALAEAVLASPRRTVGAPTMVEAAMVIEGRFGPDGRRLLDDLLVGLSIDVQPFDQQAFEAAREAWRRFGKGNHPARLNLGDCLTYGIASQLGAPILCVGNDFAQTDAAVVPLS